MYACDIAQLRSEGYTYSAIRLALLEVGIDVSLTTVKREAARPKPPRPVRPAAMDAGETLSVSLPPVPTGGASVKRSDQPPTAHTRGQSIAAEFMSGRTSNPLVRRNTAK